MRGKGQTVRAISDAAPWSDWEVASLCLVAGLVEAVTKKGGTHPLLGDWHRFVRNSATRQWRRAWQVAPCLASEPPC
jgi:hypothetical protein